MMRNGLRYLLVSLVLYALLMLGPVLFLIDAIWNRGRVAGLFLPG